MDAEKETSQNELTDVKKLEVKEKLHDINKKLLTMEWDKRHNQFNAGMESKYDQLKKEQGALEEQVNPTQS